MTIQRDALDRRSQNNLHDGEIIVVDNDESMRELLALILSLEGFPVTCFADGESFLRKANTKVPVCVFLDILMPGRSGIQILKELKAQHYKSPIFLVSAKNDAPTVVEGLKNGAHDFLHKPLDPYNAVQRVRDAVEFWNHNDKSTNISKSETREFPGCDRLTSREAEVLEHVIRGDCSKEIARSLGIGKRTVDSFRTKILRKLGAKNSIDLVRIVMS